MESPPRILYIDLLKFYAISLVVLGHSDRIFPSKLQVLMWGKKIKANK